ncbi:MAG: hypothetical protein IPP77_15100 [Bacteroidetes bacterium]|nr:hypothetical protein [Bacteroidota bacterium]
MKHVYTKHFCCEQIATKIQWTLLTLMLVCFQFAVGSNYYWVGGSGTWSDFANHWATTSGGTSFYTQIPTSADDVFFDANSFTGVSKTITINSTLYSCHNMDWTNAISGAVFTSGSSAYVLNIYGSLILNSTMVNSFNGTIKFSATTAGNTITTNGKSLAGNVVFDGVGGGWILQDVFTTPNGTITLNSGTLNSNGQTVNCSSFTSTVATPRGLIMGSSVFNVSYISFTSWQVYAPGLTLNAGTSTINLTGNNPSFSPGIGFGGGAGLTYYDLNVPGPCKSASIRSAMNFHNVNFATDGEIYSSCTFNNLTFSPNHAYTLTNGTTQTINGSLSATATCTTPITLKSSTPSIQATINSPNPVSVAYLNIRDMKATGAQTIVSIRVITPAGHLLEEAEGKTYTG